MVYVINIGGLDVNFIELLLIAFTGLIAHWLKKWASGQTDADFKTYMLTHKKNSIASVCTVIASIVGMYSTGVADAELAQATAFLLGYTLDSATNKTPENK